MKQQYGSDDVLDFMYENHWNEWLAFAKKCGFKFNKKSNTYEKVR